MSWQILENCWGVEKLSAGDKMVLCYMGAKADANQGNLFYRKQETIAKELKLSERTVIRAQKALLSAGHITPAKSKGRAPEGTARFAFIVHPLKTNTPTGDSLSPVKLSPDNSTGDKHDRDTCQVVHLQVTNSPPTGDKCDTPIITTIKQSETSLKRLNVATTAGGAGQVGQGLSVHRSQEALENGMMAELREILGDDDMRTNGGGWRERIRNHRAIIRSGIDELKSIMNPAKRDIYKEIRKPAAWLTDHFYRNKNAQINRPMEKTGRNAGTLNNPDDYAGITGNTPDDVAPAAVPAPATPPVEKLKEEQRQKAAELLRNWRKNNNHVDRNAGTLNQSPEDYAGITSNA